MKSNQFPHQSPPKFYALFEAGTKISDVMASGKGYGILKAKKKEKEDAGCKRIEIKRIRFKN